MTWHRLNPSSDDDNECANTDCGVIVSDDALNSYSMPCPAPPCTDPGNEAAPCVIVPGERGPVCAYCGTAGARDVEDDDSGPVPTCRECGNDDGPYGGLCLDCLETVPT